LNSGASEKKMARDHFFPTPIYYTDLHDAASINARVKERVYAWRGEDPQGEFRTNEPATGGWHSVTDMHTRREYDILTVEIFEFIHGIFTSLGYDPEFEPVCDSMWVNINPRHASNRHHTHPHALWSGVYYVQTPVNCGLLYFTDPRPQAMVMPPYYDLTRRAASTWNEVHYQPQEGRLIAFPAWLPHAVQPNLSDAPGDAADRISVSFNFYQRRIGAGPSSPHRREVVRGDLRV
jgi:uncharacterized protein (TIGR02466 family)